MEKEKNKLEEMYLEDKYRGKLSTIKYKIERQYLREYYSNLLEEDDIDEDC